MLFEAIISLIFLQDDDEEADESFGRIGGRRREVDIGSLFSVTEVVDIVVRT